MTNIVEEVELSDVEWEKVLDRAEQLGSEHGYAQGTWIFFSGPVEARAFLDEIEEDDPEILATHRSPLSGEYADGISRAVLISDELDLVEASLSDTEIDQICTRYEEGHARGFRDEVTRTAHAML